ncbi:MAG: acyl dehydratase [Comamonas sp.]|uniref:MaoC family dehydratase n=1 Tax=Comamonas sp. TaxID=34028 RepID=UPI002FC5F6F8
MSQASNNAPVFEDLRVGDDITALVRGPITTSHLMRWSAAIENWHRIHYDLPFATEHDKLPGLPVNGTWKQHFLVQMMREWLTPAGWLWKIDFSFRKLDVAGSTLTAWGRITALEERDGMGYVTCEIGIRNQDGQESTPGTAIGVLPLQQGKVVPYPYPDAFASHDA